MERRRAKQHLATAKSQTLAIRVNHKNADFTCRCMYFYRFLALKMRIKQYGIEVDHCIIDAGYYCGENTEDLDRLRIPYLLRLRAGNKIYDDLIDRYIDGLDVYENRVIYGNRVVFIKCVPIDFHGSQAFAYVSIDHATQADERRKIYMKNPSEFKSDADRDEQLSRNSLKFHTTWCEKERINS